MASTAAEQVAPHQGQVGGLDGGVGARPHGQPQVGLGQGGGVVHPVSDHGHDPTRIPAGHAPRPPCPPEAPRPPPRRCRPPPPPPGPTARCRRSAAPGAAPAPGVGAPRPPTSASPRRRRPAPPAPRRPRRRPPPCGPRPRPPCRADSSSGGRSQRPVGQQPDPPGDHERGPRRRPPRRGPGGWRTTPPTPTDRRAHGRPGRRPGRWGARRHPPGHRPGAAPRMPSTPSAGTTSISVMRPVVTVPVLSSTIVSTRRVDSSTSGPLISRPSWAPRPVPTTSAVGVARPSAQGQAMISTATAAVKAVVAAGAGHQPEAERAHGQDDDDGDEDGGDPVGQALHGRLAALGLADQPGDLGQLRVRPHPGGPHHEPAAGVDGGAGDRVPRADLDGHRLAGQQRGVDGRAAVLDDTVGGHLLAGADHEAVPDDQLLDGEPHLGALPQDGDLLGPQLVAAPAGPRPSGAWPGPPGSARPTRTS